MAATTLLTLLGDVAEELGARINGTFTATANTALTVAAYPFQTNRTNASARTFEGAEILTTSGTAPVPNPNGIAAYAPSTGVFTPAITYTTVPGTTATFDIYLRGLSRTRMLNAINKVLRQRRYRTVWPYANIADNDMNSSATTSWTATNATHSKVTDSNVLRGERASRVVASAAAGYIQSATLTVDPGFGNQYYAQIRGRGDIGTARFRAWDVTNSAAIDSLDWAYRGYGNLHLRFTLPSTCEALAFRLISVANADDCYWDDLQVTPEGARELPLPSWFTEETQVRRVLTAPGGQDAYNWDILTEVNGWSILFDDSNPNNPLKLVNSYGFYGPIWIDTTRPYSVLSADSDTTFADREWIALAAAWEVAKEMARVPGADKAEWGVTENKIARKLAHWNMSHIAASTLRYDLSGGFGTPYPLDT